MQARLNIDMESFAQRIKARREELGLTQAEVAKLAGLKQPDISKMELGGIKKTTELLGLARALDCSPSWLETGKGPIYHSNTAPGPQIRGTVPLLSSVQAGNSVRFSKKTARERKWSKYQRPYRSISTPLHSGCRATAWNPSSRQECCLIVEPELDPQNNDFVIVKNGSDETTFKQLVKDGDEWFFEAAEFALPDKGARHKHHSWRGARGYRAVQMKDILKPILAFLAILVVGWVIVPKGGGEYVAEFIQRAVILAVVCGIAYELFRETKMKLALIFIAAFALSMGVEAKPSSHSVKGHVTKKGTYVAPSRATNPNKSKADNYSHKGNVNPATGKKGTKK